MDSSRETVMCREAVSGVAGRAGWLWGLRAQPRVVGVNEKGVPPLPFPDAEAGSHSGQALPSSFSSFPSSPSPSLILPLLSSPLLPSSTPKVTGHIYSPDTLLGPGQ